MLYKNVKQKLTSVLFALLMMFAGLAGASWIWYTSIPDNIQVFSNETRTLDLPMKDITISVLPEKILIPGGQSVGIRMDVQGVLIVGLEEIPTDEGMVNPGLLAGLQIGDSVLAVDGTQVSNATEVQKALNDSGKSGEVTLKIKRKDEMKSIRVSPVKSQEDGSFKLGVWVKEKTAGLGTVTYFDPQTQVIGALGHGITENNTGEILQVAEGQMMHSRVESVLQGRSGQPGEIRGIFYEADEPMGELLHNSQYGIFGVAKQPLTNSLYSEPLKIGYQAEIEKGPAYILTTIDGNTLEKFEIEIEKINRQSRPGTKGMIIRVTDQRLLAKSGGIVQGMSGSPIIQNGKIVGAVTHVLVNDPQRGYGIFIEWMLKEAEQAQK